MKVLYLFNKIKNKSIQDIKNGKESDNHFFGMLRLAKFDINADYLELENSILSKAATFIRKHILNIHFIHLPLFFRIFKYDLVFTSTAFGTLFLKIILGFKSPKWIMFDFNIEELIGRRENIKQKVFYYLVSKCDGIITISNAAAESMKKMFPMKANYIQFVPLGTDIDYFQPSEEMFEEDFLFSPGRDPGRDYKTLLESVDGLPVDLKITAKDSQIKNLLPLSNNIKQYDFTPLELRTQYSKAKVVILPLKISKGSNNAMGCSTLVEAMAMGKAIIATETNTTKSYIEHGVNGLLVPAGDPVAMREAISTILYDENKRKEMGRNARQYVVNNCSADIFAERLSLYFKKFPPKSNA
jgi:glycosyltransferase involved in cell wall biosynthesis